MKTRHIAVTALGFAHLVVVVAACAVGVVGDPNDLGTQTNNATTSTTHTTSTTSTTSTTNTTSTTTTSTTSTTTTTTSTSTTTTTTTTSTVVACLPLFEIDCGNGTCVSVFLSCNGFNDCPNGADEDVSLCGGGVPPAWSCDTTYYGTQDGCDCGCGAPDPDCLDATSSSCDYCDESGSCNIDPCPGTIDPNNNWLCQ